MDLKKKAGALGIASSVLFAAGIAGAAWTTNGDGSGTATSGTDTPLTVTDASDGVELFPGGSTNITVNVDNDNPYNVNVSDFVANGAITSNVTACDVSTVTFTPDGSVDEVVAANSDEDIIAGSLAMDVDDADDDCKTAVFTVPVTAHGASTSAS